MRRLKRVALALLALAVLAEIGLRVAGAVYLRRLQTEPPGEPGEVRVVCLGESSTAGLWTKPEDSYPAQLERALREAWPDARIRVVVPPHIGQNTSQIANRLGGYLSRHKPRLVIVMSGYNNEWSLAESHVGRFLSGSRAESLRVRALVALDGLRLFRLGRWTWLKATLPGDARFLSENRHYAWGAPELARYPPAEGVYAFALRQRPAFVKLWHHDVGTIVRQSRGAGARVLLMTYHINPSYLPPAEMAALARAEGIPLVRNDETFAPLVLDGSVDRYLFHDAWHPNERGYALIARNAFDQIVRDDLLGLGPPRAAGAPPAPVVPAFPAQGRLQVSAIESDRFLGRGWGRPEGAFRWTEGSQAELLFRLAQRSGRVLRLRLKPFLVPGRLDQQRVQVAVNGRVLAAWTLRTPEETVRSAFVPAEAIADENVVALALPDAAPPSRFDGGADGRELAVAVEWAELRPPEPLPEILDFAQAAAAPLLGEGWSRPEGAFRWSEGASAEVHFALPDVETLRLRVRLHPFLSPGRLAAQRVRVTLNGTEARALRLDGPDPREHDFVFAASDVRRENVLRFELPDAAAPSALGVSDDPRVLGVAVETIRWVRSRGEAP
jgi:lysophospholipase L1-like esterase